MALIWDEEKQKVINIAHSKLSKKDKEAMKRKFKIVSHQIKVN